MQKNSLEKKRKRENSRKRFENDACKHESQPCCLALRIETHIASKGQSKGSGGGDKPFKSQK